MHSAEPAVPQLWPLRQNASVLRWMRGSLRDFELTARQGSRWARVLADRVSYARDLAGYAFFNRIPSRPRNLSLEVTNRCNLVCVHCDRAAMTRTKKLMEWPLFERICLDAINFGIPKICLGWFGESLLHPQLPEMVAFAKKNGAKFVEFVTNGTLLTEERARAVLSAGLDCIQISMDGFNKSTFEQIRLGASYDEVVANTHRLLELRDKLRARTIVQLNFVCTKESIKEVRDFHRYWRKGVDRFYFLPFVGYESVHGMSTMTAHRCQSKCYMLWYMIVATVDGRAGVCCFGDPNLDLNVGNLRERSLKDVWNGPEIQRIRRIHFQKRFNELPVCARCDLTSPYTRWAKHFLETYRRIYVGR